MVPMLLDDLLPGHADAVVGHRDGPRRRVVADPDARLGVVFEERGVAHRLEPQLVGGIGGVRDELAQEDLLVPVQGVNHQVQELRDLGLESERLFGRRICHGNSSVYKKRAGAEYSAASGVRAGSYTESIDMAVAKLLPLVQEAGAIDPVCGMTVNPATAKFRAEHDGRTYYFCCGGCQAKFTADPAPLSVGRVQRPGPTNTCSHAPRAV